VCLSQFVAERSGYSFSFSNQTDQGIRDGKIGKGQIEEEGCEETFHC
jgi:hypothetical protein